MAVSAKDDAPVTSSLTIEPERELFAETVTIARPPGELYAFWHDLANVAPMMGPFVSVMPLDGGRTRWTIKGAANTYASWTTIITEDRPGSTIFWKAEPGGDVENGGRIDFLDAGPRGCILRVTLAFEVSRGILLRIAPSNLGGMVRAYVRRTLRSFKQMMEAGEIATPFRHRRLLNARSWQIDKPRGDPQT